jgi:hypothetical protein
MCLDKTLLATALSRTQNPQAIGRKGDLTRSCADEISILFKMAQGVIRCIGYGADVGIEYLAKQDETVCVSPSPIPIARAS